MPVDFSALVLAPAQAVFGRPITVDPLASQPGAAPYAARGIFSSRPIQVPGLDGTYTSDQETTLSIRLADYDVPPHARDLIIIDGTKYAAGDTHVDGQGGMTITLRKLVPEPFP